MNRPQRQVATCASRADRRAVPAAGRHGGMQALPRASSWAPLAMAGVALTMLVACQREPDPPPLPRASLDASQAQALQQMNAAGATAFAGWTWRYEFGAGCRLRVIKRYEDRPIPVTEYLLVDQVVELVPYPGSGFGVKAYPRTKPGSADLFDARTEPLARAFAADVQRLLARCDGLPAELQ
jgi:hypothetical protein